MKKFIILFIGLLPTLLAAQMVQRQAITSGGTATVTATGLQVSQTIGQPAVKSWANSSLIVSEGFQQGTELATSTEDLSDFASFNVFPNPMSELLNLEIESSKALNLEVSLRDVLGRETAVPTSRLLVSGKTSSQIDCSQLAVGSYLLMVKDLKSGALKSLIVQKVQ